MDWMNDSSGRMPALQAQSLEFKSIPSKKKRVHMVLQGKEEGPQEGVGTREMKRTCSVSFPLQDQIPEIDN
jgi:hypothetical protein